MILTEHLKAIAGRWMDRNFAPAIDLPVPLPRPIPVHDLESDDDGTGMWLPAGLVDLGDEVNVAGRWYTVTGTDRVAPSERHAGIAVLHFGAWSQRSTYAWRMYVRDEAARIKTQVGGAQ